jgi:plastocyanin
MNGWHESGAVRGRAGRLLIGAVLVGSALAGCGSTPASSAASPSTVAGVGKVTEAPDGVEQVTIQTQDDYAFTPKRFTVKPGRVRLTVVNTATQITHNFRFTPGTGPEAITEGISLLAPGERKTIEFTVTKPGAYGFECSFHTQLGQVGTMTVSG